MIGSPVLRTEDRPLLTGAGQYLDDIGLPGSLHTRFFRSPSAHAVIERLDLEAARSSPGVRAAFSHADLNLGPMRAPIEHPDAILPSRPLLANEVVRFVGEPVVMVVADSAYAAEDALDAVEMELSPREAMSDPIRAIEADAPPLHEWDSNELYDSVVDVGDVDEGFEEAAVVVERSFVHQRCNATPIEPRGVIAAPDGDGVLVWSSTQVPHKLRNLLTGFLDLPAERVRIRCPDLGGGFGLKCHAYPEEVVVAWAALQLGAPIKWVEDRRENLLASSHARDQLLRIRAAADDDGRLLALEADIICDGGAYGVHPHGHILEALGTPALLPGPYRLPAYRARTRVVATNKCPAGAYRGVGLVVAAFVHERVMDLLAGELGLDRAEIRRRNFIHSDEMPYRTLTGLRYDSGDYASALETALEAIDYDGFRAEQERARGEGRLLGIGISSYVETTGLNSMAFRGRGMMGMAGYDGAHIALDGEGGATVWTTLPAIGQGVDTTFAQMVAEQLGLEFSMVRVERVDTGVGDLDGTGTIASRSAISGGGAIATVTTELRARLLEDAGERLEAAVDDLEIVGGSVRVVGSPAQAVSVAALVVASPERFAESGHFDPPQVAFPYATHACRVEVDAETGAVTIERYVIVEDCGRMINPIIVKGQVHGAVAQGFGGTLYEHFVYDADTGEPRSGSLMDYVVPGATELPTMELHHQEIPAPDSPNGAKGVGEGGALAPPGVIANAVSDALGVEMNELPLTPERVRRAVARSSAGAVAV